MRVGPGYRMSASCIAGLVWLACASGLSAQQSSATSSSSPTPVPRVIWFSGSFRPQDRLPIAPVESVTFAVYHDQAEGSPLWQETHDVAVNADGGYNVLLGSMTPEGLPLDLFAAGEPRWLGVRFNRTGELEQPRVQLTSVPYALKAADADTLGGKPASAYLLAEPLASSGTPGPLEKGSKALTASKGATSLNAGVAGRIGKFVDGTDLNSSALFQSGNLVGLGTTAPQDLLHVAFDDATGAVTGYAVQNTNPGANAYAGMLFYDQNGALGQFQGFNNATHEYRINNIASGGSMNFMIGGSSKLLVANNGNVTFTGLRTQASQNGPSFLSANMIGGSTVNTVGAGVTGVVIAGGGATNGFPQTINANYSSILGGYSNTVTVSGFQSTIAGGVGNTANNANVTIGGGNSNTGSGNSATVGGGNANVASGSLATVPGGINNTAAGLASFAAGKRAKALNDGSFVWGDSTNADVTSTTNDQMTIRANGGVVVNTASNVALNAGAGVTLSVNATNALSVPVGTLYKDNTVVAWGRVSANALSDAFNVASVTRNSAGNYTIVLKTPFTGTALVPTVSVAYIGAQPTTAATMRIASTNQLLSNTAFNVFINNGLFAAADADFTFIVTGR
jgi:hypothetical protein